MNEFEKFLQSDTFKQAIDERVGTLAKADTVDQNTGLVWYDLSRIVQEMHPFKQLIPLISSLPRVPADGGTAHRWKRVTGINVNNVSIGGPGPTSELQDDGTRRFRVLGGPPGRS